MAENKNITKPSPSNDEIDLIQLFRNIGNSIKKLFLGLFNICLQFIIFSIRKFVYLTLAVIVGLIISYSLSKIQKDYYYSDLVLKSNAVQNQEMIYFLNRLKNLTSEANYSVLASSLNLSIELAENISDIKAYWFIDFFKDGLVDGPDYTEKYFTDTSVVKVEWKFGVRATVTDPTVFNDITEGLIHYIESNEYFQSMNKVRLEMLDEIIQQTGLEVEKLDSLQKKEYFQLEDATRLKEGQLLFTNDPEVKLFHRDLLNLLVEKHKSQTERSIHSNVVSILENFTITQVPINNIAYYARKIVPLFIGLAYLLALFIAFRKNIIEAIRK